MKTHRLDYRVLALIFCLIQQGLLAAAQEQQPRAVAEQIGSAASMKSGAAGGPGTSKSTSPALTGVRRPLYRLCKSDVVTISFTFSPEFDQTVSVQPDGYVTLTGVKQLPAEGVTVPELQEAIGEAYAGVLHDPEVTIILKDFDKPYFIVGGEVNHPAKYELRSDTRVTEAVAIAGGLTPRAKHSQVVLFRRVSDDLVESHLLDVKTMLKSRTSAEDIHLRSGDFLFVPQNLISKIKQYLPTSSMSMYASPTQF
ncbi:MAG TPA: polysaccharide biosynthesis/export family protein [Terriglobales bacterium]|nr:polysaccharide biosynthesis/export family protein [Terriglobales bacterium]